MENYSINSNKVLYTIIGCLIGVPIIFYDTFLIMANTWNNDETYTHGFLIFPIVIGLIWQKRKDIAQIQITPEPIVIVLLLSMLFAWIVAKVVDVQVVQQLALITIIIISIWLLLGRKLVKLISFPLLFLYLAIPFGKALIPPLMEFTAQFTVLMVQTLGIPIYQDGLQLSLPTGNWSVVEACSGLNYFIASMTLGLLYAYTSYSTIYKQVIFVFIIMVVSILANGMRAAGIVTIGHFSNMKYGTGGDHVFYGWIFYGIVIFILFYVGSFWRDQISTRERQVLAENQVTLARYPYALVFVCLTALMTTALFTTHLSSGSSQLSYQNLKFHLPDSFSAWQFDDDSYFNWFPSASNPDIQVSKVYRFGGDIVQLSIAYFLNQRKGAEAISSANKIIGSDNEKWVMTRTTDINTGSNYVTETEILHNDNKLLVWSWYRVGKFDTPSPYVGKILEAYNKIILGRNDASIVRIATALNKDIEHSRDQLQDFWKEAGTMVNQEIDRQQNGDN